MKIITRLTIFLIILFFVPYTAFSFDRNDLIENFDNGTVNWSKGIIVAKGIGAPPQQYYNQPNARPMAIRAAKLDAYRNVLEVIQGVRIDSSTTVSNYAVQSDVIMSKVEGMVQGVQVTNREYLSDGTVEVTVQMDMRGGFSQLLLPEDIRPIEPITPITPPNPNPAPQPDTHPMVSSVFTGLVVDARGLNVRPAMAPKIFDENGQEVYGSAYVSREFAVQQGMSGYAKEITAAQQNARVSDNPLTVKGIRTEGAGRSDIVISNADAAKIRSASEHLSFLKQCRVMIVVD